MVSVCFVDVVLRAPTCGIGPSGHFGDVCPSTSAVDRITAPELACLLPGVPCVGGGGAAGRGRCGQEQGVFSHPGSLPPSKWRVKGGFGCTSGLLEQKVLEHGLLGVPLAEVLPLCGPGFLCAVPVLHLRFRLLSPSQASHRCVDLCVGWLREASGPGHAVGG